MSAIQFKNRFIRSLPGRVRMEVYGLKQNKKTAGVILERFQQREGILDVSPCIDTGRVLIDYGEKQTSLNNICKIIRSVEEEVFLHHMNETDKMTVRQDGEIEKEAAATTEVLKQRESRGAVTGTTYEGFPENFNAIPEMVGIKAPESRVPLPLALSIVGLGVLGIKQLLVGRSTLARSTGAFYLSGIVSVVAGYPFLKRGFQQWTSNKKLNADLILGASSLALALVRENVVLLAGLSILQYLNWKRSQATLSGTNHGPNKLNISRPIQSYSEKQSKLGMVVGVATWAITGDPLRTMGVLLGANPRPATVTTEYAWNQAELVSKERGYLIPDGGSLSQLSRTKTVLLDDTSYIFKEETKDIRCISHPDDEDQVWCVAASLMKKSNHAWKEEVTKRAKQTRSNLTYCF